VVKRLARGILVAFLARHLRDDDRFAATLTGAGLPAGVLRIESR
jgi:hypothetical protein